MTPHLISGQNVSFCNLANSGGQAYSTLPSRQTSASSLSSTYPKFSNPSTTFDRVALYPPNLGFRGPRPGTRLPAHPGPSRALGPARAHPAPSQHTLLTDCPDSDSALPQATIQLSPIGTSCQTQAPAQLLALTAASDSDDSPEAISLSCTFGPADKPGAGPSRPTGALSQTYTQPRRRNGPPVCYSRCQ